MCIILVDFKGAKKMENQQMLKILYRVKACLSNEDWFTAKEYIILEIKKINNLKLGG